MNLSPGWQSILHWRLDAISFFSGVVCGIGLAYLFLRVRPRLLKWRDQSLNRVQKTQAWVRAGVEKRFQVETSQYISRYHLGSPWATLDEIFVTPAILVPAAPRDSDDSSSLPTATLLDLWPDVASTIGVPPSPTTSLQDLLLNGRRVLISGAVGSGKSTLLSYCAYLCTAAEKDNAFAFLLPVIPVFVHLAQLDLHAAGVADDPVQPLAVALQQRLSTLTGPGVGKLLRKKLDGGNVLLLLDGYDELPDEQRRPVADWLGGLLTLYPNIQVIAAAPEAGYEPLVELEFIVSGIAPWRAQHALQLGQRWAKAFNLPEIPDLNSYWEPGQSPLLTSLRLWQLCHGELADATRLTDHFKQASMLRVHRVTTDDSENLDDAILSYWQALAFDQMAHESLSVSLAVVERHIGRILQQHRLERRHATALRQSLEESALFIREADKSTRLYSPLWRDYLAGGRIAEQENQQAALDHLRDPYWQNAIRFYVGHAGESGLANLLFNAGNNDPFYEHLFQLAEWLPEVVDKGTWKRSALVQLGQLVVKPGVPLAIRHRAVAALATSNEPGVPALLRQLLQRSDAASRQIATSALARIDPEQSVPLLEEMLRDGDPDVRLAAVHALGWQYSPVGEKALLNVIIGRDDEMRQAVCEQLALNGGEHWQILKEAASDEDLHVRRTAAHGLKLIDKTWARKLLQQMELSDPEWVVKSAAALALEAIAARQRLEPWRRYHAADLAWMVQWAAERQQAAPGGTAAIQMLCELLEGAPETSTRIIAARSLASVVIPPDEQDRVWSALRHAAQNDTNDVVREVAFMSLAYFYRLKGVQRRETSRGNGAKAVSPPLQAQESPTA